MARNKPDRSTVVLFSRSNLFVFEASEKTGDYLLFLFLEDHGHLYKGIWIGP